MIGTSVMKESNITLIRWSTTWKVSKYGVFSGPYFPVLGLNTEIYGVNLRIYRKIRTRKYSVSGHFSRSGGIWYYILGWSWIILHSTGNYLFKVNNRKTRTRCEICSKLTIKTPERRLIPCSSVSIVNFV